MANRSADEDRRGPSDDPLKRVAREGPVRGDDASERAANLAGDEDAPLAPEDTSGRNPDVRGVPPVMPAGAAANMSVDSTSASAGGTTGPQGAPAAAAMIAGEIAFSQDDFRTGWDVLAADDATIGRVAEVGPERILVDFLDREGQVYIPYTAVTAVDKKQVHLAVPSGLIDRQDWQQVRPGGPSSGVSPPPLSSTGRQEQLAGEGSDVTFVAQPRAGRGAEPDPSAHAGPVTTGRGVEEGPTHQPIRAAGFAEPAPGPVPPPTSPQRPAGAPMPPEFGQELGPMRQAQDMMNNVRGTVQGAAQGQMSPSAPKEAFADMFSFLENIPNSFYYLATVISVISSLVLFVTGKRWESLFVGLWAPTIVSASMFYKLLRPSHEVRSM